MKRNMSATMERLKIDSSIRDLIEQLWKHCYKTTASCEGHGNPAYIMIKGCGDGWFERNAQNWGLKKQENGQCCKSEFEEEVRRYGLDPKKVTDQRKSCGQCGAGVNGYTTYRGDLVKRST